MTGRMTARANGSLGILLPYQVRWNADRSPVKIMEKSRRIGLSYGDAAESALVAGTKAAAGGMPVWYISYNQTMTETYIKDVGDWAKRQNLAASEVQEVLLEDEKDILAYRVRFASGNAVTALSSKPKNLRSKKGRVVIDEAAFCDELPELLKAALALIMWGGQVEIISTHDGEDNPFSQLIQDVRAGKYPYSLHRVTLDDALSEGLYRRICEVKGEAWSPAAEAAWRQGLIDFYGDGADEELFCVPSRTSGSFLNRNVIENCMDARAPVVRWVEPAPDFVDWDEGRRRREIRDWLAAEVLPLLKGHAGQVGHGAFLGVDFGRSGDLTVLWPLVRMPDTSLITPCVIEMKRAPFAAQDQAVEAVEAALGVRASALDATGMGAPLAEAARQRLGAARVAEVKLSEPWYREHMPAMKAAFEDRTVSVPRDSFILDDLRAFKLVRGVARIPERSADRDGSKRHGDAAIALALALFAARTMDQPDTVILTGSPRSSVRMLARAGDYAAAVLALGGDPERLAAAGYVSAYNHRFGGF